MGLPKRGLISLDINYISRNGLFSLLYRQTSNPLYNILISIIYPIRCSQTWIDLLVGRRKSQWMDWVGYNLMSLFYYLLDISTSVIIIPSHNISHYIIFLNYKIKKGFAQIKIDVLKCSLINIKHSIKRVIN